MQDFLAMGGYALYVWTAWGAGAAILAGLGYHSWSRARRLKAMLDVLEARWPNTRPRASFDDIAKGEPAP